MGKIIPSIMEKFETTNQIGFPPSFWCRISQASTAIFVHAPHAPKVRDSFTLLANVTAVFSEPGAVLHGSMDDTN
jgi:hypothetical protein